MSVNRNQAFSILEPLHLHLEPLSPSLLFAHLYVLIFLLVLNHQVLNYLVAVVVIVQVKVYLDLVG